MDPNEEDYGYKVCPDCKGEGLIKDQDFCDSEREEGIPCTGLRCNKCTDACKECGTTGEVVRTWEDVMDEKDYRDELDMDIKREI